MFFIDIVQSNDSFNFPLGLIKYIVILILSWCFTSTETIRLITILGTGEGGGRRRFSDISIGTLSPQE